MGDNKISEAAVEAAVDAWRASEGAGARDLMRDAIEAALPHLQGEAVPVAWLVRVPGKPFWDKIVRREDVASEHAESIHANHGESPEIIPLYDHPQPAELSEPTVYQCPRCCTGMEVDPTAKPAAKLNEVSGNSGELGEEYAGDTLNKLRVLLGHMCDSSVFQPPNDYNLGFDAGCRMALEQAALAATGKQQVGEPKCSDCETPLLYECTGCSATNYPPQQVGEVQGAALPPLSADEVAAMAPAGLTWDETGAWAMGYEACRKAALASRQPVGAQGVDLVPLKAIHSSLVKSLASIANVGSLTDEDAARDLVVRDRYLPHLGSAVTAVKQLWSLIDGRDAGTGVGQ